ncbi:MAG TPA: class I SAM-dependent methyltransferase [Chitinophagaceae bacterium]|nr:class I SAM-dependent methyltransferase [Chitinophagaceae bacterium]
MQTIHHEFCPVCGSTALRHVFYARDHLVTGESFPVIECAECSLRFTQDAPDVSSIADYYRSEDYISHSGTSRGLVSRLYHRIRRRTLRKKRNLAERLSKANRGRLLDVGAGTGHYLQQMKEHGWLVMGTEPSELARQAALHLHGIELQPASALFQFAPASFDLITLWHVLEHLHDLHASVGQLKKLLSAAGTMLIAVPNYQSKDSRAYGEYWAAYDVPRHLYHFSPQSMQTLLQRHDLKIVKMIPMWYDSFYISLLSSRYKTGTTRFVGALWTGLVSNAAALKDVRRCSSIIYVVKK